MTYANQTTVSVDRSLAQIKSLIMDHEADLFTSGEDLLDGVAKVEFRVNGKYVRFIITIPHIDNFEYTPGGAYREPHVRKKQHAQGVRQRWRQLLLMLKGKFEAVEAGVVTFEEEFLPYFVMPDNSTVANHVVPMLEEAYETGKMPVGSFLALTEGK